MPRNAPQVAHSEDYDSEAESVKPGTRKDAKRRSTTSRPPKAIDKYRSTPRDAASDSGYSSHASGVVAGNVAVTAPPAPAVQAPPIPPTTQSSTKTKPILHRSESQRSKEKAPSRSSSTSRQRGQCGDPWCQHALCHSARSLEGQQPAAQSYFPQYALQYTAAPQQYHQMLPQYQYQYAQVPQVSANQTVPLVSSQTRPRQGLTSRPTRPASIHGYSFPNLYANSNQGPPPAASAYQNMQYAAWVQAYQQQQQQQAAYQQALGYGPPVSPSMANYPQQSPVTTSPTSPAFTTTSTDHQLSYSARIINGPYEGTAQRRPSDSLTRAYSARPAPVRTRPVPGAYPPDNADSSDASSDSDSSSQFSDEEYERDHRSRARDSRLMSSSSDRRPSLRRQSATLPLVPTRSAREVIQRNLKTDTSLDYISSSDNMDSDRTARAVVDRPRTTYTSSARSSRRPSVATTTSSGRTKATTVSSTSGLANVIAQRGQRDISYYATKDRDAIEYIRQRMDGQRLEDAASAYQKEVGGSQSPELTRDNIREHRRTQSHYSTHSHSHNPSRRGSRSSSRKPESTRIESGGTVIHVYPGSTVEMRPGKDGASTLVIGTASGKDKRYYSGSRHSSDRRSSRTYVGSESGSKHEGTVVQDAEAFERSTG